jgi:hypothetical protein
MTQIEDERLAELTDNLLAGRPVMADESLSKEARLIRLLAQILPPQETEVPSAFRQRLSRRLEDEWTQSHTTQSQPLLWIKRYPRLVALAAALGVALGAVLVWSATQGGNSAQESVATSTGDATAAVVIVFLGALMTTVIIFYGLSRKR